MAELADFETVRNLAARSHFMSFDHIREFAKLNSSEAEFLKLFATEDVFHRKFEFDGSDVIDDYWTFAEDGTATGFAYPSPQVLGGALVGVTGTTDNGAVSMIGPTLYKGDTGCGMHVHLKFSAVTNLEFEVGFIDAITDATLPAIGDIDTPANGSNGAADIAVIKMDTDQTLTSMALVCDGTDIACSKSNIGTLTPTADTYLCVRLSVFGNNVQTIINNRRDYWKRLSNCIEGGTLLAPWIFTRCRAGSASRTVSVDVAEIWGMR